MINEQDIPEMLEKMSAYIHQRVAGGFDGEEDIREHAIDMLSDHYAVDALRPYAERLTREALAAHLREQATWPERTDCDRLDAVFAELERGGIIARQNYSCCGNCGAVEIRDEMMTAVEGGRDVRGYTFYHVQDTEGAVEEGDGVYLSYGALLEEDEEAILEIAREIVAAIRRQGLEVEWDGTLFWRIRVAMEWRRRRSAR